jgi:transcriptional antiterminator
MGRIFGYNSSDIEAQYKQDRYLKEADQYRLISQINMQHKKTRFLNNPSMLRASIRRLRLSHSRMRGIQQFYT